MGASQEGQGAAGSDGPGPEAAPGGGRPRVDVWTTRGLGLALPIERGDTVAIVGTRHAALATSLRRAGGQVVLFTVDGAHELPTRVDVRLHEADRPLPLDGHFDHVIVATFDRVWLDSTIESLADVVAPNGHVLVAGPTGRSFAWEAGRTADQLRAAGFAVTATYGIRQTLHDVRHLVPLTGPSLRWYARDAYLPRSPRGDKLMRLAAASRSGRLLRRAFPAIALVGNRSLRDEG